MGAYSKALSGGIRWEGPQWGETGPGRAQIDQANAAASQLPSTPAPPPAAPDLTDALLKAQKEAEILRGGLGRGRKSTFLTGPEGIQNTPTVGTKTLLGS